MSSPSLSTRPKWRFTDETRSPKCFDRKRSRRCATAQSRCSPPSFPGVERRRVITARGTHCGAWAPEASHRLGRGRLAHPGAFPRDLRCRGNAETTGIDRRHEDQRSSIARSGESPIWSILPITRWNLARPSLAVVHHCGTTETEESTGNVLIYLVGRRYGDRRWPNAGAGPRAVEHERRRYQRRSADRREFNRLKFVDSVENL